MSDAIREATIPSIDEVAAEKDRLARQKRFRRVLRSTIYVIIVVAAISVLLATMFLPVLQVSGSSMEPTLEDNDVILLVNTSSFEMGDLVGFYYQNKILLKRVIAGPGDVISIDDAGNVTVNDELIDEPYVTNRSLGECDLTFPYQVPDDRYFMMGDNREISVDSRSSVVGCIEADQIVGKVVLRVWPLSHFSFIK